MLLTIFIILLALALAGSVFGHSRRVYWGWWPTAVLVVLGVVLFSTGQLGLHG